VLFLFFVAGDAVVPVLPVASAPERFSSGVASLWCFFEVACLLRAMALDKKEQNLMTRTRKSGYSEWRMDDDDEEV
jgi:hypothetical protein